MHNETTRYSEAVDRIVNEIMDTVQLPEEQGIEALRAFRSTINEAVESRVMGSLWGRHIQYIGAILAGVPHGYLTTWVDVYGSGISWYGEMMREAPRAMVAHVQDMVRERVSELEYSLSN